jgi:lipopolysaccharide transport system ATP-binding protein
MTAEKIYSERVLGMTKKEIALKIDEMKLFSGCERYMTPCKRYSSGMTVRLALLQQP